MGELQGSSRDHLQAVGCADDLWRTENNSVTQVSNEADSSSRKCCAGVVSELHGWVKEELIALGKLAFPLILTLIFQQTTLMVSMLFVGHITGKPLELDSAALSLSFVNITGIALGVGLASAADTLCSQTYGFKNYVRVGHIFQRGVLILFAWSLFTLCVWLNTESLLLLVQQSPCVARLCGGYVQIFFAGLPAYFVYIMLQKYLNSQGIVWLFILVGLITNILNPVFHAIFISWAGLGVNGAAISMVFSNLCQPLLTILYVWARKLHKKTWEGWSMEALRGWGEFLRLGLPGAAMICIEWLSFEIAALILGSIDEIQLAINSVVVSMLIVVYMVPLGISIAGTVRVGNELGAGQPLRAKRAAYTNILVICGNALLSIVFLQAVKNYVGKLFTSDESVLEQIPAVLDVASIMFIPDQIQISLSGIIRGCGRQALGASVNFIAYYFIGLPIGISLALAAEMGTVGMWMGLACASFVQAITFIMVIALTSWEKESLKASQRAVGDSSDSKVKEKETDASSLHSSDSGQELVFRESGLLSQEEEKEEKVEDAVTQCRGKDHIAMVSLNSNEDAHVEMADNMALVDLDSCEKNQNHRRQISIPSKANVKLVLSKGSVFVLGVVLVVAAGFASQYHPPDNIINGNYSECTSNDTVELLSPYTHFTDSLHVDSTIHHQIAVTPTSTISMSSSAQVTSHTYWLLSLPPTPS